MFYISPHYVVHLPILKDIYLAAPYAVYLISYVLGFVLAAFIVYAIQFGLIKLTQKLSKKSEAQNA